MERYLNLNISRENELLNIVTLAAEACQTPAAFLVFLEEGKMLHQVKVGKLAEELPAENSFWNVPLTPGKVLVIPDVSKHETLGSNPAVTAHPDIRFYAGIALVTHDGQNIGSLYVIGQEVKPLSERRKRMLQLLSRQAVTMVEFELSVGILKEQYFEAKNAENKLRSFFESSKSSHLLIGRKMEVLTFNKTFFDMAYTLYEKAVTAGALSTDFIFPKYVAGFTNHVKEALNGESVTHERLIEVEGIESLWCKISYNPTFDSESNIIGVSFNVTDITQRKKSEEKILKQNEALRKIAYLQSHELRKPVASILGLMNLLMLDGTGNNQQILQMMEKAVLELDTTIHQIVNNTETQFETDTLPEDFPFDVV